MSYFFTNHAVINLSSYIFCGPASFASDVKSDADDARCVGVVVPPTSIVLSLERPLAIIPIKKISKTKEPKTMPTICPAFNFFLPLLCFAVDFLFIGCCCCTCSVCAGAPQFGQKFPSNSFPHFEHFISIPPRQYSITATMFVKMSAAFQGGAVL